MFEVSTVSSRPRVLLIPSSGLRIVIRRFFSFLMFKGQRLTTILIDFPCYKDLGRWFQTRENTQLIVNLNRNCNMQVYDACVRC